MFLVLTLFLVRPIVHVAGWQSTWPFLFPSETISSITFDLIYFDVRGLDPIPSLRGFSYYVSFIDNFAHITWIYLVRSRYDVYQTTRLQIWFTQSLENVLTYFVRMMSIFVPLFLICFPRIAPLLNSCVHTPSQNQVAERKHRHILEMTRALYICLHVGTCGLIRSSNPFISSTALHLHYLLCCSPYEHMYSCSPTYIHLRIFGCTWFIPLQSNELTSLLVQLSLFLWALIFGIGAIVMIMLLDDFVFLITLLSLTTLAFIPLPPRIFSYLHQPDSTYSSFHAHILPFTYRDPLSIFLLVAAVVLTPQN